MPIKSCNVMQKSQAKWMNLFQSDFVKPQWLHILPIFLISNEKARFQQHWFDKPGNKLLKQSFRMLPYCTMSGGIFFVGLRLLTLKTHWILLWVSIQYMVTINHHKKNQKTKKRETRYYTDDYIPYLLLWKLSIKTNWFTCGWINICFVFFFRK